MFTSNKSLLNKAVTFMVGLFAIAFTFYACDTTSTSKELDHELTFENVKFAHQLAMENIHKKFEPTSVELTLEEKIDFVSEFNKNSLEELSVSNEVLSKLNDAMDEHKNFIVQFNYESPYTKNKTITTDPFEVNEVVLNDLKISGLFHEEEIELMRRTVNIFNGSVFLSGMADSLANFKAQYKALNYNSEGSYFQTGIVLAIAEESHRWWTENPDAGFNDPAKVSQENYQAVLPGLIATDAAGAVLAGGATAIYQGFQDDFDWGAVGYAAVAGAVIGSTGAVGRLAKWFSKL